ncbi:MAG TPA: hypothetical protein VM870_08275, partial [Pyrinomonadaceae bacterium]|nr:hypothetical protein [Pyrinomonadaceae bacterium]
MSKKKRRRQSPLIVFAANFLAFFCCVATPVAFAQQQRPAVAPSSVSAARSEAVKAATNEVLAETGELRRLPPLRPVVSGVKSREEIKNPVVTRLNEETTPQEMHANEAALRAFGLVDASFKLRPFFINLLTEQIAGYYDPRAKEFYLADWIDLD